MGVIGGFWLLELAEIPNCSILPTVDFVLPDGFSHDQFLQQRHHVDVVSGEDVHLQGDRLPLKNPLVVGLNA